MMLSQYQNKSVYLPYLFMGLLFLLSMASKADDSSDVLDRIIHLEKSKDTVYRLLGEVSEKAGLLFIYDSKIINNVLYFEQKDEIHEPLYRGELYIDSKNNALLRARFEIQPKYVEKAAGMLVEKVSRNLRITPQKVTYTLSYKSYNGTYYINHIRGDLHFKIKKRRQLFSSFPLHTWFEMVTCKINTQQATRFTRNEALPTRTVFSETNFSYDESFWGNFNVIPPEEKLNEAISQISSKIEETSE